MNLFMILAFLFFVGSVVGWVMELFFRKFISDGNPEHKWINPGFCTGPYLPIYGCGLCVMYLTASLEKLNLIPSAFWNKAAILVIIGMGMTVIEYIAGIFCMKKNNMRLWDYSNEWGNVQGIICPKFSLIWTGLGAVYYFFIHPHILNALDWLSNNLAFSFVIGLFFGVFIVDAAHSAQLVAKLKQYAEENDVIVRYEQIKTHIRYRHEEKRKKYKFFHPFRSDLPISEHLKELLDSFEKLKRKK